MTLFSRLNVAFRSRLFNILRANATRIESDELYLRLFYLFGMGRPLSLNRPVRFSEKIQKLKLLNNRKELGNYVDKYLVRDIIKNKIGEKYLVPLVGVYNHVGEINKDILPNKFVIKTTHDSGSVIVCKSLSGVDWNMVSLKIDSSLKRNYFFVTREYPYKYSTPRIIIEKYLDDPDNEDLIDYKFFCFNGVPKLIQITIPQPESNSLVGYFNMDFEYLSFHTGLGLVSPTNFKKPESFQEMKEIAAKLSEGFIHVRIDLYYVKKKVYFGEYTFHNAGGIIRFDPDEWDMTIGQWVDLH